MLSTSNLSKLKTNLRLSIGRLKLLEKKKTELAQKSRKEIADYISQEKVERAKIRVEHIIREDYTVEAMEIVEMYCDTLLARFGMIEQMKTLDEGIEEAVSSLIWVAPRLQSDVKELKVIHDILMLKYGKAFAAAARENQLKSVNEKLMIKMGVQSPPKILVERYLIEIAKTLNVHYEPDEEILREDELYRKGGGGGGGGGGDIKSGLGPPPPGFAAPLIDLDLTGPSGPIGSPAMPPPLPQAPPAVVGPSGSTGGPIGFNMIDQTESSSDSAKLKDAEASAPSYMDAPALPPGVASVPPSYESAVSNKMPGGARDNSASNLPIPEFDESCLPNLPDIPQDDEDEDLNSAKKNNDGGAPSSSNNANNNDDFDFDDLRRRFAELKKKKY